MSNTLNPFGTFGTGYDVGTFGQAPTLDEPSGGGGSKAGSSSDGGGGDVSPPPPATMPAVAAIPQFSYTLKAIRRVNFINNSLNAVRYLWTFYLKQTSTVIGQSNQENPIFFYPYAGTGIDIYNVKLRAYNADGDYVDTIMQVEVENLVPYCDFTYIVSGTIVRFTDTSTNIDSDSPHWSFGDFKGSTEKNPHHTYDGNGRYTVTLVKGAFNRTQIIVIDAEVILECDPVAFASGYKWERSANGVDGWVEFVDTELESIGVTEAVHGIDSTALNYFRVKAYNDSGESDYSDVTNVRCL